MRGPGGGTSGPQPRLVADQDQGTSGAQYKEASSGRHLDLVVVGKGQKGPSRPLSLAGRAWVGSGRWTPSCLSKS